MTRAGAASEAARGVDAGAPAGLNALPLRGAAVRELGLPIPRDGEPGAGDPPPTMPSLHRGRPLKRWRYVGAFGPELMLCAGDARVGPLRQRWWALAEPDGTIVERASALGSAGLELGSGPIGALGSVRIAARGVAVELEIDARGAPEAIEVASPSGPRGWAWTRKRVGAVARGVVEHGGRSHEVELETVVDDSAGYHERHTSWSWCAGVGRSAAGQRVGWNLVSGVHDDERASECTVWVDGEAAEVGPVRFAEDLSGLRFAEGGEIAFEPWVERRHRANLIVVRSRYRQPFGRFSGELPGSIRLADGHGVMESHDAWW